MQLYQQSMYRLNKNVQKAFVVPDYISKIKQTFALTITGETFNANTLVKPYIHLLLYQGLKL